jgi:hypothetical protein
MGLAERPVFETETRGLDPVSNRSQCASLLARSGLAEGGGIEPLTFAVTLWQLSVVSAAKSRLDIGV